MSNTTDPSANPAKESTEPPIDPAQTPTETIPTGSDIKTASVRSTEMRAVGKYKSAGAGRGTIQA